MPIDTDTAGRPTYSMTEAARCVATSPRGVMISALLPGRPV
jgi:hypothetical protein